MTREIEIREATEADEQAIAYVAMQAFGRGEGPEIVALIAGLSSDPSAQPVLSLVATLDREVVGHILFSRVRLPQSPNEVSAAILSPLAVHPDVQSRGIGGRLIGEGLRRLGEAGVELVFVLGHPGYYPRFGFAEAGVRGFEAHYPIRPVHAGAWMVKELRAGALNRARGRVVCADALAEPKYWTE